MATINNKLIHFKSKSDFNGRYAESTDGGKTYGDFLGTSIVFIQDAKQIWTHGQFYDANEATLASLGITATAAELNKLDGITATTQELNYVDGVTSNIQTQLNGKAASSHNHSAANITSGTLDLARIPSITDAKITSISASKITGTIPQANLPSYVDDVLEYSSKSSFPQTGESGKIYVDTATNLTYRWGGSSYVEISPSLALGETSSTAFRGDRGKIAYDHSQATGNPHNLTLSNLGISATAAEINKLDGLATTAKELGYVHGVTSNIQTQLNAKANASALSAYALKDGSNASGAWGISISGIANRAVYLTSTYTGSGGLQPPSYFNGMGLKVNMMNHPVSYCDVIFVNGNNGKGSDVPYVNALAFQKTANAHGEVYHARGDYGGSSWGTWYKFLDEYNYAGILDSRYLLKSAYTAADILAKLKTVDGSGSGLNADLLDGYHLTDLSKLLSYIDSGTKTAAGWYRVFTASSDRTNALGVNIILHLARSFGHDDNEAYTFCISVAFNNKVNVTQVSGHANKRLITKIRVVSVNSGALYVDFYLSTATNGNTYFVSGTGPGTFQAATAVSTVVGNVTEFTTVNGCKSSGGFTGALTAPIGLFGLTKEQADRYAGNSNYYNLAVGQKSPNMGASLLLYRDSTSYQSYIGWSTETQDHIEIGLAAGANDLIIENHKAGIQLKGTGNLTYNGYPLLHSANYTNYTVTKTGGGASGWWPINVTGAAERSNVLSATTDTDISNYVRYRQVSGSSSLVGSTAGGGAWGLPSTGPDAEYANGQILRLGWSPEFYTDIFTGPNDFGSAAGLQFRQIVNGKMSSRGWRTMLDSANYTSYTVSKTGGGASGTWNINISGTAASANSVAWNNVSGKPSSFTPSSHTHGSDDITALTGYREGSSTTTLSASMSLNAALASLQNQVQTKAASTHTHTASQVSGLADVATSGDYNDLSNKPTIPSLSGYATQTWVNGQIDAITPASIGAAKASHTHTASQVSGLSKVATSGSYNDLTNKPSIPAAVIVDSALSSTSTNPVQNKVINSALAGKAASSHNHSAANITSGTLAIARIPTGTTASTVALGNHTHSQYLTSSSLSGYATQSWVNSQGFIKSATDTKNTAGSTNTSSKLFLIGATSQAANPVTYSNSSVYTTNGDLHASSMHSIDGFYETSDARLKTFGEDIKALEVVSEIPTKYFTWKSDESKTEHIGTSAQEIQKLYPDLVTENEDGVLSVDYARLSIIALAAIKELKAQIDELKSKIN